MAEFSFQPIIGVANTNFDLVEKCHQILNSLYIPHHVTHHYRKAQHNNSPQKAIQVVGFKRVLKFIEVFGGFVEKKGHLKIVKELIVYRMKMTRREIYGEYEDQLWRKLRELNHKGILRDYTPNSK